MTIPLFRPTIRRKNMDSVLSCLVSDRIEAGPKNLELASTVSSYIKAAGGFCLATYRLALKRALDALNLQPHDRVIISALAPDQYLKVMRERDLVPLLADVDPDSAGLKLASLEKLLPQDPKAIILHYHLGFIPEMPRIMELGIPVIEDISQALGARVGDTPCGSFGQISILSLGCEGVVTAGGGGILLIRDRKLFRQLQTTLEEDLSGDLLSDLNASLGLSQMKEIEKFLANRAEVAEIFRSSLLKSRHKTLIQNGEAVNIALGFPVMVRDHLKQVRHYALKKNIETRPAFADSIMARFRALPQAELDQSCPDAQRLFARCLLFPLYPSLGRKNVQLISKVLASLP